jgi:hypothetical protein
MDIHQNSLQLLENYLKQTPKDQIEALFTSIDLLETNGNTFREYLEGFDKSFDYALMFDEDYPAGKSSNSDEWTVGLVADEGRKTWLSHDSEKGYILKIEDDGWHSEGMTTAA